MWVSYMKPFFNLELEFDDIEISLFKSGVQLKQVDRLNHNKPLTLKRCFALPYSVYLLDLRGATVKINQEGINYCGFKSLDDAYGKTIFDVSNDTSDQHLLDNCQTILSNESIKIFDEVHTRKDNKVLHFLSFKFPCYNHLQVLSGIFGISIVLGSHPLASAIDEIRQLGLLPQENSTSLQVTNINLDNFKLSNREKDCLALTLKGYTAKNIAKELTISHRTVEDHLKQIKLKLNVSSKQELIQKLLN